MLKFSKLTFLAVLAGMFLVAMPVQAQQVQKWELINPKSVELLDKLEIVSHDLNLEGKTVVLRWNGKNNGDNFLTRLSELLTEKFNDIKIVKVWEERPETSLTPRDAAQSNAIAQTIADYKPDLVIASQAD